LIGTAYAQQPQQPSPHDMAVGQKLLDEINASIVCQTGKIMLQSDLDKANMHIKELEAKYEPKKNEPAGH